MPLKPDMPTPAMFITRPRTVKSSARPPVISSPMAGPWTCWEAIAPPIGGGGIDGGGGGYIGSLMDSLLGLLDAARLGATAADSIRNRPRPGQRRPRPPRDGRERRASLTRQPLRANRYA